MDTEIILFDTDATIEFLRDSPELLVFVNQAGRDSLFINPIVFAEVLYKGHLSKPYF